MFARFVNFLFLTTLLVGAANVYAGIRPSFSLDGSSWEATEIVIAGEGEVIDGNFVVLESLKGELMPGETIDVPELAKFKLESSRLVKLPFGVESVGPPQYVSGRRMILFLKKSVVVNRTKELKSDEREWKAANLFEEMSASVVWLEGDKSFAFQQFMNPGPSELVDFGKSETELRKRAHEVIQIRASLNQASAYADGSRRAEALAPFTASEFHLARLLAFEELQKGGVQSLPVLFRILKDESNLDVHDDAIRSLVAIGGEKAGPVLTEIVRAEMLFWKSTAPRLKEGWWNAANDQNIKVLQGRYAKVLAALYGLRMLRFVDSREVVFEFRTLWQSLPQLGGDSGSNQLSEECEEVLKSFQSYD